MKVDHESLDILITIGTTTEKPSTTTGKPSTTTEISTTTTGNIEPGENTGIATYIIGFFSFFFGFVITGFLTCLVIKYKRKERHEKPRSTSSRKKKAKPKNHRSPQIIAQKS